VTLDLRSEPGEPLDRQKFTWHELVPAPISKLDDDAFTRVRVILMSAIESDALRFSHVCSRLGQKLRLPLAQLRRVEQHQQTMIRALLPPDQSVLETTIAYEQTAIAVTASLAQHEPDPELAQMLRTGLVEDLDHLYRFAALIDRIDAADANVILQGCGELRPGRPTIDQHRAPADDLRRGYDRARAAAVSKLNALTVVASAHETRDYYLHVGPRLADPVARLIFAEIASVEEQHASQYECLADPDETWLEKLLLHEATEVYTYWSCAQSESNPRLRQLWERFCAYELGQLHFVAGWLERTEERDPWAILPTTLPDPIDFSGHREFLRQLVLDDTRRRDDDDEIGEPDRESPASAVYRAQVNADGSPTQMVAAGYRWAPGTEILVEAEAAGQAIDDAERAPRTSAGGGLAVAQLRARWAAASAPPGSFKLTARPRVAGEIAALVDKLGERLAFERLGVRLYDALVDKWSGFGDELAQLGDGALVMLDELRELRAEELLHVDLVRRAMEAMGADPTAQTPAADVIVTASSGLLQVMVDPRTTLAQSLDALVVAELADNAGWELVIELAQLVRQEQLVEDFARALTDEREHLRRVRGWCDRLARARVASCVDAEPEPMRVVP
jgi:rubrerythrin